MEIYSSSKAAKELGPIIASHPSSSCRVEAVEILGRYDAGGWEIILALLPGLADPDPEVYQATVLAFSRMK